MIVVGLSDGLLWRVAVAWLAMFGSCVTVVAKDGETLPHLIPEPKHCALQAGALSVVSGGQAVLAVLLPERADPKEVMAAQWIAKEIGARCGVAPNILTGGSRPNGRTETRLVLASFNRPTERLRQAMGLFDQDDRTLLEDPKRSEQGYVIRCTDNQIAIVGGSPQGTLYGAMTLLQLFQASPDALSIRRVHIRDWPDFRYRVAENWTFAEGRENWGRGWCYDWGDGAENYRNRVIGVFDRCLRYKINMICFSSGFDEPFSTMWSGDGFPIQKELNRLAAQRGIKLMLGGYGVGAGDKELLNRESYPDGQPYLCMTTTNYGNCRSNDALTAMIQGRLREYVRKVEPRALYLHHEDSDSYASAEWLWRHRCGRCRNRWPNDAMASADGAAGAFVHGYNALCEAIFSVKNADSGYDASRDCLLILVSPSYTASSESDAIWDRQLEYWTAVGNLLKCRGNVCICIREQFLRNDNDRRRIQEMAARLRQTNSAPGLFLFSVSPASIYGRGPLFVPVPAAMSRLNEGAEVAYYMCGNIFQEPQILMNAAHMWNTDSLGTAPIPPKAAECVERYNRYAQRVSDPPGVFGEGGFLQEACRSLYGEKAAKHMEKLYSMKQFPICLARELFVWHTRSGPYYDWTSDLKATHEALACVDAALGEPDCNPQNRPILARFQKCLGAGERFIDVRLAYGKLASLALKNTASVGDIENGVGEIDRRIEGMERYLADNFTFDWATPRGGDVGIWKTHLADTRREVGENVKQWMNAIRAREAVQRAEASGKCSLVVNGGMEESTGWKYVGVTGKEQIGYADGGYVSDKALCGKRSYRIVKLPVDRLSDQWPMPRRTSWGQIEQQIEVEPGRAHAVVFNVYNNNPRRQKPDQVQHEAYIDDRRMWAFDSSAIQGWIPGGFVFIPTARSVRLIFRTTDVKPAPGWARGEGDSWWDQIKVYPLPEGDR